MTRRKKFYILAIAIALLLPLGIFVAPIVLNWLRKGETKELEN